LFFFFFFFDQIILVSIRGYFKKKKHLKKLYHSVNNTIQVHYETMSKWCEILHSV